MDFEKYGFIGVMIDYLQLFLQKIADIIAFIFGGGSSSSTTAPTTTAPAVTEAPSNVIVY